MLCSWCQAEDKPSFLRELAPYGDTSVSHGICVAHQQEQLKAAAAERARQAQARGETGS